MKAAVCVSAFFALIVVLAGCTSTYVKHDVYDGGDTHPYVYPQGNDDIISLNPEDTAARYTNKKTGETLAEPSTREKVTVPEIKSATYRRSAMASTHTVYSDGSAFQAPTEMNFIEESPRLKTAGNAAKLQSRDYETIQADRANLASGVDISAPSMQVKYIELSDYAELAMLPGEATDLSRTQKDSSRRTTMSQGKTASPWSTAHITFSEDGRAIRVTEGFEKLEKTNSATLKRIVTEQEQLLSLVNAFKQWYSEQGNAVNAGVPLLIEDASLRVDATYKSTSAVGKITGQVFRIVEHSSAGEAVQIAQSFIVIDMSDVAAFLPDMVEIVKLKKPSRLTAMVKSSKAEGQRDLLQVVAKQLSDGTTTPRAEFTVGTVKERPRLNLIKTADNRYKYPGDIVEFSIYFNNTTVNTYENVIIADSLSRELTFVEGSARSSRDAAISVESNEAGSSVIKWHLMGEVAPGDEGIVQFKAIVK